MGRARHLLYKRYRHCTLKRLQELDICKLEWTGMAFGLIPFWNSIRSTRPGCAQSAL